MYITIYGGDSLMGGSCFLKHAHYLRRVQSWGDYKGNKIKWKNTGFLKCPVQEITAL